MPIANDVRECSEGDLARLRERWPTPADVAGSHYAEQQSGHATFLVAWQADEPLGSAVLLWSGCVGENARTAFPDCVEIIHLQVREKYRGRGVGTAIIAAAEQAARNAGKDRIALGVDFANANAARLYRRMNYRPTEVVDTAEYQWCDDNGIWHDEKETSELLVKQL